MKINVQIEKRILGYATMEVPDELIDGTTKRAAYSRMKKKASEALENNQLKIEWDEEEAESFVESTWFIDFEAVKIDDEGKMRVQKYIRKETK